MESPYYAVPNLGWKKIAIIGGGPSLKDVDWDHIQSLAKDYHFIGCNAAYKLGNWVSMVVFGDKKFWDWNKKEIINLSQDIDGPTIIVCPPPKYAEMYREEKRSNVMGGFNIVHRLSIGWSNDPNILAWNSNSGSLAANLASHLGAERIVLLGFDMKPSDSGKKNWHDYHKYYLKDDYGKYIQRFFHVADACQKNGIEVVNACPGSAMPYFHKCTIEEAF